MGMGVHGFGGGGRAEKLGHLGVAFLVRLFGKRKIFTVGLGLTCKRVS
jgi:hypothetical protein